LAWGAFVLKKGGRKAIIWWCRHEKKNGNNDASFLMGEEKWEKTTKEGERVQGGEGREHKTRKEGGLGTQSVEIRKRKEKNGWALNN